MRIDFPRHWLTLSSFSPLFILVGLVGFKPSFSLKWIVEHVKAFDLFSEFVIPTSIKFSGFWFFCFCLILAIIPNLKIHKAYSKARKKLEKKSGFRPTVRNWQDGREAVIGYVFANLLPFYQHSVKDFSSLLAYFLALGMLYFLFYRMQFFFLVPVLVFRGFHFGFINPDPDGDSGLKKRLLIFTKQDYLFDGT